MIEQARPDSLAKLYRDLRLEVVLPALAGSCGALIVDRRRLRIEHVGPDIGGQAEEGQAWDMVVLVRYPHRRLFAEMARDPENRAGEHMRRREVLGGGVLRPTKPLRL